MDTRTYDKAIMPRQKLLRSEKDETWRRRCTDGVIASTKITDSSRRRTIASKKRNYDLMNNKIDISHFEYVTNPYTTNRDGSMKFQLPATLQPYDILYPIFSVLFGEEAKRTYNPIVRVCNESAISQKEDQRKEQVLQTLGEYLQQFITPDPNNPNPPPPEQVIKNMTGSIKDMREITGERLLNYYKKKTKTFDSFCTGWKDWLIAGEEFYEVGAISNELRVRRVNPLQIWFQIDENTDQIDQATKILEIQYKTASDIVDEFFEYLTPDQIDELETHYSGGVPANQLNTPLNIKEVDSIYSIQNSESFIDRIPVYKVRWKSFRKIGIYHSVDPQTGEELEQTVDESWKFDKRDPNNWIEWIWISEYWEGIRIADDMYIDELIRPRQHQYRSQDNLSSCKSGYIGNLCSAQNSESTSLMDRVIPWVYLYFIIWYDTELALATNIGKIALLDMSIIPDGWDVEKWMYYARAMRIGFVNSLNESNRKLGLSGQNHSQVNRELNLETGSYIQFNITLLQELERKIQNTAGVPPQRLGAISSEEAVGNVNKSLVQSSLITEELFRVHNGIKLRVCECILEVAKDLFKEGKTKSLQYVTDDMSTVLFSIDPEEFNSADYGIFVTDAIKDMEAYAAFKDHIKFALQNDQMAFHQIADIYTSESVSEMKNTLKKHYDDKQQQAGQQQQDELKLQQSEIQQKQANFEQDIELRQYITDTTNSTKIQVAEISVYSKQLELDQNGDGIPDPIEIGNQALKERDLASKAMIDKMKLEAEKMKHAKEMDFKKNELATHKTMEDKKLAMEDKRIKADIQIAKMRPKSTKSK